MLKLWKIILTLLSLLLISCAIKVPTGPVSEPSFSRCQTCSGTTCVAVWFGQSHCRAVEDEQGRFCTAHGRCIIGTFGGAFAPFKQAGVDPLPPQDAVALAAQKRFNNQFSHKLVGKLKSCWRELKGEGVVTIEYDFTRRKNGNWVPYDHSVVFSTLADKQDKTINRCMRDAIAGIRIPFNSKYDDKKELKLVWTWPVPLE